MLKVDGVAAVVGDYVVLDSDIDKECYSIKAQRCFYCRYYHVANYLVNYLEDKLYAHHAIQDSIDS